MSSLINRYASYRLNGYYRRELRPFREVYVASNYSTRESRFPDTHQLRPLPIHRVYGGRGSATDLAQGIFGYFFGGGWAFGLIENNSFRVTAESFAAYRAIVPGPNGTATLTIEWRAGDPRGIQVGTIDLDSGQSIPNSIGDNNYYLVRKEITLVCDNRGHTPISVACRRAGSAGV